MRTFGIVIKKTHYLNDDLICNIVTPEFGIITFLAKSGMLPKNKNFAGLQQFSINEYFLFNKTTTNIGKLQKCYPIKEYYSLFSDINKAIYYREILDIIWQVRDYLKNSSNLFDNLTWYLDNLNNETGLEKFVTLIMIQKIYVLVNKKSLVVDKCVRCGSKWRIKSVNYYDGGFICHNCFNLESDAIFSLSFLKNLKIFIEDPMKTYRFSHETIFALYNFYGNYFETTIGVFNNLNSLSKGNTSFND
ncbi:hypothetical protein ASO20_02910 [Mycoplasma sp. (ex Biomphalaria glabrata)]|uniref:DNA repair protein RecO n=1 Tax=Mycoplasma sp. (ex Biomphalaria glabrata) TaxID=1749074 RepID=UPI00073A80A4|nr:DNA repair protein RecO [Mycoplasma sp. (ex Biomphalaria glabrata)]ALV23584.1 hypothetical protein ASO20_02910 [Mycoplasma sp. (ex Biomphalaria glabrata)]